MATFAKPFKTIDEQVEILKERGLVIHDEERTKLLLLSNNYYNIINGYSKFFPTDGDRYTAGTSFDEVVHLHILDTELKHAFFKNILAVESHIKAIFAYRFAEAYPDVRYSYLDIACYDPNHILNAVQTIHSLSGIINRQKHCSGSSIHHYVRGHNNVPIWVLINQVHFGDLRYMIINSRKTIQNKVSRDILDFTKQNIPDISNFPPEHMNELLVNINELRNVCAHNNRLIGFKCRRDSKYWPALHERYNISHDSERRDVYSTYLSLQCFSSRMEFASLHNTIRKRIRHLSNQLHSIDINKVLANFGFPDNWHNDVPKIPQE